MVTGHQGKPGPIMACRFTEFFENLRGVRMVGIDAETGFQFHAPFGDKVGWTNYEERASGFASPKFRPDEAGFDGLSQPDFIGDEQAVGGRLRHPFTCRFGFLL